MAWLMQRLIELLNKKYLGFRELDINQGRLSKCIDDEHVLGIEIKSGYAMLWFVNETTAEKVEILQKYSFSLEDTTQISWGIGKDTKVSVTVLYSRLENREIGEEKILNPLVTVLAEQNIEKVLKEKISPDTTREIKRLVGEITDSILRLDAYKDQEGTGFVTDIRNKELNAFWGIKYMPLFYNEISFSKLDRKNGKPPHRFTVRKKDEQTEWSYYNAEGINVTLNFSEGVELTFPAVIWGIVKPTCEEALQQMEECKECIDITIRTIQISKSINRKNVSKNLSV